MICSSQKINLSVAYVNMSHCLTRLPVSVSVVFTVLVISWPPTSLYIQTIPPLLLLLLLKKLFPSNHNMELVTKGSNWPGTMSQQLSSLLISNPRTWISPPHQTYMSIPPSPKSPMQQWHSCQLFPQPISRQDLRAYSENVPSTWTRASLLSSA